MKMKIKTQSRKNDVDNLPVILKKMPVMKRKPRTTMVILKMMAFIFIHPKLELPYGKR
jgi:hypothetical protein